MRGKLFNEARFLFWIGCYFFGFFASYTISHFSKPTINRPQIDSQAAFSLKTTPVPDKNEIAGLSGLILGELEAAHFANSNELSNINISTKTAVTDQNLDQSSNQNTQLFQPSPVSPVPSKVVLPSVLSPTVVLVPPSPKAQSSPTPIFPVVEPLSNNNQAAIGSKTEMPPYEKTIDEVILSLINNDFGLFYNLLSSEIADNFKSDEVERSFVESQQTYGKITSISPLSQVFQYGDWATQDVEVKTQQGVVGKFKIVLHLEDKEWKLFGTQELP